MKRSPLFHLVLGLMVVLIAFWVGAVRRWQMQRQAVRPTCGQHKVPTMSPVTPQCRRLPESVGFIVKYKSGAKKSGILTLLERLHAREMNDYEHLPGFSFQMVESAGTVEDILKAYRSDPNVEFVEPNFVYHLDQSGNDLWPNDPGFEEQWGHHNTGQPVAGKPGGKSGTDIGALGAWGKTTGDENVVVGVIDSGVDYNHPDLAENMWVNDGEIPDNGIDDDGNGVVDDVHGYNAPVNGGDPMDDHSHGTHCAGIIGAVGDNDEGVVGVNWTVRIMALKFLSANGSGTLNDALECINYALEMKSRGVNLRVLSNSWGGGGYSQALEDAIKRANDEGVLFVAAAGNDRVNTDDDPHYPSGYKVANVISVAALDSNDHLASFSNFGEKTVHLAAPGVDVYSTILNGQYAHYSGTSMATPYVSGVAALILAREPDLKVAKLKARILDSTVAVDALKGKTITGGRLNAERAVR